MMKNRYILSIDQSTQGTKALLLDETGKVVGRADKPHRQLINNLGYVSHDLEEIYQNTIEVVRELIVKTEVETQNIEGVGISNQRETTAVWDKKTKKPVTNAIVWQCARATDICKQVEEAGYGKQVREKTGIQLSPYFPASKMAWILKHVPVDNQENLLFGTIDTWLIYQLTKGESYKTDYSNASRTQLFNIHTLSWDETLCEIFQIPLNQLPLVCDSDSVFGKTDFEGLLPKEIPIRGVLGDSHGALFGQGCLESGMTKATYGTGSSVMMNVGEHPVISDHGVVTSLAWKIDGKISYVLEGNINYTGAVITWLKEDLGLISDAKETQELAVQANPDDTTYLVPAFTGLGAPYWNSDAKATITGITRMTKKPEIVRAALDCIAYQIADIIHVMGSDAKVILKSLRVDGGPTRNEYLMQFQSDITNLTIQVPESEELSGIGVAYLAGISMGIYDWSIFSSMNRSNYSPTMKAEIREEKKKGWKAALLKTVSFK